MLVIVNYGAGNIGSLLNMCKNIGIPAVMSDEKDVISEATHLILPGVGAFDYCKKKLDSSNLIPVLEERVLKKEIPILGICVGMQLLSNSSEEGEEKGLGWITAETIKITTRGGLKVPHMGWNKVQVSNPNPLFSGLDQNARFYFVHSYHVRCQERENAVAQAHYGIEMDVSINLENIYGVQFHPEKSHDYGKKLLSNFFSLGGKGKLNVN